MDDWILLDELHVTVRVSASRPATEITKIRRTLISRRFQGEFRRAIKKLLGRYPSLAGVRTDISR